MKECEFCKNLRFWFEKELEGRRKYVKSHGILDRGVSVEQQKLTEILDVGVDGERDLIDVLEPRKLYGFEEIVELGFTEKDIRRAIARGEVYEPRKGQIVLL